MQNLTILRLPDVIGPFDETKRLMKYVAWMTSDHIPQPIGFEEKDLQKKLSFVYSLDVVKVILQVIDRPLQTGLQVWNIGCQEQIYLGDFLVAVKDASKSGKEIVHFKGNYECQNFLPSVECGPISITRARTQLDFNPTPLVSYCI